MRLIITETEDEAERKRVDYQVDKHQSSLGLARATASWILSESDDVEALVHELVARLGADSVRIFEVRPLEVDVEEVTRELEMEFPLARSALENFLFNYVIVKRKGALTAQPAPNIRMYEVFSNKGRAEVKTVLKDTGDSTRLVLQVTGVPQAADFLSKAFRDDLELFRRGADD